MVFAICSTKNQYFAVDCLLKQLLLTQKNIERIYVFCEGDLTYKDERIIVKDVSNFDTITKNHFNARQFTYIALTRCYFTSLLPNEDKILYLDTDLVIEKDLSELWNIDMTGYAFAAVRDNNINNYHRPFMDELPFYFNSGVLLMNLKYLRDHKLEGVIHKHLNNCAWSFPDQDVLNIIGAGHVFELDCKFNSSYATSLSPSPSINHGVWPGKPWQPWSGILFRKWCHFYFSEVL